MAEEYLSAAFAERISNFTWKPWHPHRILTQRPEPIANRIARLRAAHARSKFGNVEFHSSAHVQLVVEHTFDYDMSEKVRLALLELIGGLVTQNHQCIAFPDIEIRSWTAVEAADITDMLDELETRLQYEVRIREYFLDGIERLIVGICDELVPPDGGSSLLAPLYTFENPATIVSKTIIAFTDDLCPEADSIRGLAFYETRAQLITNLLSVSKLTFEQYQQAPHRIVPPADCDLDPDSMVRAYLSGTPLLPFLETPVPFAIPQAARFEHCHIIGGTGHGKTQLLQTLALADFDDPTAPSVVIIDSQGDMVRKLSRLKRFANNDRLIIVDPSDTDFPLALNIFDIHKDRLAALSLGQREQILAGIIELYDYIFGSIGADLTQKQSVVFRYITRLMLDIPHANIQTLRLLMENDKPFRPYIDRLTGTTRAFFDNEFSDKSFISTKQQIRRRLYGILSNPTFERLFSSDTNKLDMTAALDSGKVILINTAKDVLKSEASAFFGRYMIALVMQAAFERAAQREDQRRPAFLYIDEAADYFDGNIDTLLIQARKFKLGVTLAHQFLDQLTPSLRASIMTNPAVRFAGGVSQKDANALDSDMRTTAGFLMGMHKSRGETEFACYVRNVTRSAVQLKIPLGTAEREARMTNNEYDHVLARSRALVAEPLSINTTAETPEVTTRAPQSPAPITADDPAKAGEW